MIKYETLREWQKTACSAWFASNGRGIFLSCTGSGKSIAAMYCIQKRLVNTLIVVPTIALMNQWRTGISNSLGIAIEEVGKIGDGEKDINIITVAVINSIRDMDLSQFKMIVLDEAHRYGSMENIKPIVENDFRYRLGITATLERSDGNHTLLEKLIGPVVFEYDTEKAVSDGVLSKFEIINVGVELGPGEMQMYDKHSEMITRKQFFGMFDAVNNRGHPKWRDAIAAVRAISSRKAIISNADAKIREALTIIKRHEGKKIVVFNETIKMAEALRKLLKKESIASEIYHSKKKKQESIDRFESGETKVLVAVKSLNEGLDIQDIEIGIRVAGTNQNRDTIQRLGRGLRVVEGKEGLKYYQLYCKDTMEKDQITKNTNVIKSAAESVKWE